MLDIEKRADGSAVISGYVNAVGRDSKPVFIEKNKKRCKVIEQIQPGAFGEALRAAENVDMLLNHDSSRKLTDTASGGLTLTEDSIGLRAAAVINDTEVIDKAVKGELRGWSFGFRCIEDEMETRSDKLPRRIVKHLILNEVSVIDSRFSPCYEGTSVECRAEGGTDNGIEIRCFDSFASAEDMEERAETEEAAPPDYSRYERAIAECSWREYEGRIEERFNPYHDPVNGRFTGAGFAGHAYIGRGYSAEYKKNISKYGRENAAMISRYQDKHGKQNKSVYDGTRYGKRTYNTYWNSALKIGSVENAKFNVKKSDSRNYVSDKWKVPDSGYSGTQMSFLARAVPEEHG